MNSLKNFLLNIFGRFWATWGIITFIITFLIIFLPSMCSWFFKDYKKGQSFFIRISRIWMRVWLTLIGCPLFIHGRKNFKKGENYVIVFNHNALLDVPLSAPFVVGPNMTIAKKSFASAPLFGFFYKRGSVLVDRKSELSRLRSFEQMKKVLAAGMHMCIYPEGTRNRGKEPLKSFYDGAFKLASISAKDILPCVITGTREAMPIHKTFFLLPKKLNMYYLPSVSSSEKKPQDLRKEVFGLMEAEYVKRTNKNL